jgi:hypothetical protein
MKIFLSFFDGLGAVPHGYPHWTPAPVSFVVFLITNDANLSEKMQKCAADDSLGFHELQCLDLATRR